MENMSYGNYLQLFATEYHVHPEGIDAFQFSDAVNRLTAARREFIDRSEGLDLNGRKVLAQEILGKYNISNLDVDFNSLDGEILSTIKREIKKPNVDSRVIDAAKDFSVQILNGDVQSFNSFANYMNELSGLDMSTITPKDEEKHNLITSGIKGYSLYDYSLLITCPFPAYTLQGHQPEKHVSSLPSLCLIQYSSHLLKVGACHGSAESNHPEVFPSLRRMQTSSQCL